MATPSKTQADSINFYDEGDHDYREFWVGRDYENLSEEVAIKRLLKGQHFNTALDYGGGYGRLSEVLLKYADKYILVDPSQRQLDIGKEKYGNNPNISYTLLDKKDYVPAKDESIDLLVMVRVTHHIIDLDNTLSDIHRALKPGGKAIIEVANYAHFMHRVKHLARLKKLPEGPVPIGDEANGIKENTPFVNHNAKTVNKQLNEHNLRVEAILSVSNLRKGIVKKTLSMKQLIKLEATLQPKLAKLYFGPSIFFLVEKV
ncbi:MAG: class I SAM-dependent methyltransferase [Candidatus Saccharimonadales bacterium]